MLRVLIMADESFARDKIRFLLASHRDVEVVAESGDGQDGLGKIHELAPDAMFLDLQTPELGPLDLLTRASGKKPYTVITTADKDQAIRAFELGAVDFLMKPLDAARFDTALTRIRRYVERDFRAAGRFDMETMLGRLISAPLAPPTLPAAPAPLQMTPERVPVKLGRRVLFLDAVQMRYVRADKDYVNIHMTTGEVIHTSDRMLHMEEKLAGLPFLRVHRSVIINLNQVREVHLAGNRYDFALLGKVRVISGCSYKRDIHALVTTWKKAGDKRVSH